MPQSAVAPTEDPRPAPKAASRRRTFAVIAAGIVLTGAVTVWALSRHKSSSAAAPPPAPAVAATPAAPRDAAAMPPLPVAAKPKATYIGSAKCGECHEKELLRWQKDWHARALSPAQPRFVAGNFAGAHFTGSSSEAWMTRKGSTSIMRTRGADGQLADFNVDWVIGGKRMQDTLTVMPDGRWQVLPVYFHTTAHEWVDYTEAKQGALTPEHPFFWTNVRRMANHECLDCHTTGMKVDYDATAETWTSTFADPDVACEACHGPGSIHAETQEASDLVQPAKAGATGLAACARCHGPRQPLFPLLDADHQFKVGESYDENYDPIVITLASGSSSDFFADGRPSTSSFEYQAMLQSACYRKGGMTCLTCHTAPHAEKHGHSELRADPDSLCVKCHGDINPAAHAHHKSAAAQKCIACHMPPVVSGVLDHFVDHAIDVPAPQTTDSHHVPNACGTCHADKTAAALAESLAAWWPDAIKRQARRIQLADAFDETTARASARPLAAVIADASEAPTLRGAAAILLARRFGPQTAPTIEPLLASADLVLRAKGCEALGYAHARSAAGAVSERLGDTSLRVRLACALALLDMGDPRGESALAELAGNDATSHLMLPHLELANVALRKNDFRAAQRELLRTVELAPYSVDALTKLSAATAELGDLPTARVYVRRALALEPHNRDAAELAEKLRSPTSDGR